jgi:hypothetical protein
MLTIGFATKYYTLWDVSEPRIVEVGYQQYIEKVDYRYIQNLSHDLDRAKAKLNGKQFQVDLELHGHSSFTKESEVKDMRPDYLFKFGKYTDQDIRECTDFNYLSWYYCETKNIYAINVLLKQGYILEGERLFTPDEYLDHYSLCYDHMKEDWIDENAIKGFHGEDGERVQLNLMDIGSFSFEGRYGICYVVTYLSDDNRIYKYVGKSYPAIKTYCYAKLTATLKHTDYRGNAETHLKRIKILK